MTLKLRLGLLLLLSFLFNNYSFAQEATEITETTNKPIYNSLLWKISGNGLSKPSYLYGTMHVSQKLAFHLGKPFYKALESCDMVALELNPETWMKDLADTDLYQDPYSSNSYYENFYKEAFKISAPLNRDIAYHLGSNDNLINGLLYRSSSYTVDFEEDTYLDLYIFQTGKRMGKRIFSLEDYEEVMDFSQKSMIPDKDEEEVNQRQFNELFKSISPMEVLENAYRKGNLSLVDSVSRLMNPSKNFHKYMIVVRNEGMANNMDSIIQAGTTLFTGVGAAHLPGEDGVIELMRRKGYTLTPIDKGVGGKDKYYQDKYDDIIVPFEYEKQNFPESFFSVSTPGKLYTMPSEDNLRSLLHPNMPNGVYFWVKRIKTFDPIYGRSIEYTQSRIDSLLYENIPGDIITKKEFETEHYQGFEIVNKTRQGDKQRYNIYFTPLEVIIFKMGGSKEFAMTKGNDFFKSIQLDLPITQEGVEKVSPEEGGFAIDLPPYHLQYRLRNGSTSSLPGLEYQSMDSDGDYYLLRKVVLNDLEYIEEDQFELDQFVRFFIDESPFDSLSTKHILHDGYPALEASFTVKNVDKKLHVLFVIHGTEYFMVSKLTNDSYDDCRPYFNSLVFDSNKYDVEFTELTDSLLGFRTMTAPLSKSAKRIQKGRSMYQASLNDDIKDDVEYAQNYRELTSPTTGESVSINSIRYNAFYYKENIDSLWNYELRRIRDNYSLLPTDVKKYQKDSLYIMETMLVDTGSTRGIKLKKVLSNRRMYYLAVPLDTISKESDFITTTFDNFELLPDTVKQLSVFEKKNDLFFEMLDSGDSLKIARVFEFISIIELDKEDESRLLERINNFDYDHQGMIDRGALIELLGDIQTKSSMAFLRNEYLNNEDTVTYQLACLSALASMETTDSRKILSELMVDYPTIPSEISEMNKIYRPLFDSLAISKVLFPDFLELSTFVEYKKNNLNLLSSLVESEHLKPRALKRYKNRLISEAVVELKRQFAGEEGEDDSRKDNWMYRNKLSRINYTLLDYATIIAPWYDKDERVRKFFTKMDRMKNLKTYSKMVCLMQKSGVPVSPEIWTRLSKDPKTSSYLLQDLRENDIEEYFDKEYLTPEMISFSQLVSSYDFENDSTDIEFIGKYLLASKENPGYYYFYKAKRKGTYDDKYQYAVYYNGPQPSDGESVNEDAEIDNKSDKIDEDENLDDLLEELKLDLEMRGRTRFSSQRYYGGSDYN